MKSYLLIPFVLSASVSLPLFAQSSLSDNRLLGHVDSVVHKAASIYMQQPNTVGLSIGVYNKGLMYTYNYGEIKRGTSQLPTANTFYNIGSVAKTFVGVMLAQAIIDKKAALNDDIRSYLPGRYPNLTFKDQPIRLIHLANHTSALPKLPKLYSAVVRDSLSKLDLVSQANFYGRYNKDSLLSDMHSFRVDTLPGIRYSYNSSAMMVLSLLLEQVYQEPYEQLIANYLQTHLKMNDTKVQLTLNDIKRVAQGYNASSEPQPYANLKGFYIGPSMNSTVSDMLKYIQANLAEQDQALKLSHQTTWARSDGFSLGLGWMLESNNKEGHRIYHSGNTKIGYNTLCSMYPSQQVGVIIFVNETISQDRLNELERAIIHSIN